MKGEKYEKTIQNIRCIFFISNATFVSADVRIVSAAAIESGSVNADTVPVPDNGESSDDDGGLGVQPSKPEIEYEDEPELQEKPIEPEASDQSGDEQSGKSGTDLEIKIPTVIPIEPDKSKIIEPPSYDLLPEMSDEELQYLIDIAADRENSVPPAEEEIHTFSTFSTFSTRGYSLVNELENVYKYGSNIASQIADIFSSLPVTGKELRQQLAEVSEFVIRQDKWIVVRIDALAGVVAEHNTRLQNQLSKINDNWSYHQNRVNEIWDVLSPRIASLDTKINTVTNNLTAKDTENFNYFQNRVNSVWDTLTPLSKTVSDNFSYHQGRVNEVWDSVGTINKNVKTNSETIVSNFNYHQGRVNEVWDSIGTINKNVKTNSETIVSNFTYHQNRVNEAWTSITANRADINEHFDYQKERVNEIWDKIPKTVTALDTRITNINNSLVAKDKDLAAKDAEHFDYFQGRVNEVWGSLSQLNNAMDYKLNESQVNNLILRFNNTKDTRFENYDPEYYLVNYPRQTVREMKVHYVMGINDLVQNNDSYYMLLNTEVTWATGGWSVVNQIGYTNEAIYYRTGSKAGGWTAWKRQADKNYVDSLLSDVNSRVTNLNTAVVNHVNALSAKDSENFNILQGNIDKNSNAILLTNGRIDELGQGFVDNKLITDNKINNVESDVSTNRNLILATDGAVIANKLYTDNRIQAIEDQIGGLRNYDDFELRKEFRRFDANHTTIEIQEGEGSFSKMLKFLTEYTVLKLEIEFLKLTNLIGNTHLLAMEKLSGINDYLHTITEWLRMIYEKEIVFPVITLPEINIPVLDYARIQEMFDGISFGNVVNEAGTNIWDVMDSLVDGLSELLKSIVEIVPNLIEQIIKLIVPEDPEFFSKKFEGISTKFDSKFKPILNMGESVKGVFGSSKALTGFTVVFFGQQIDLIPQILLDHLPTIRAYATGFLYLFTLAAVYKRFVGEGDVIS